MFMDVDVLIMVDSFSQIIKNDVPVGCRNVYGVRKKTAIINPDTCRILNRKNRFCFGQCIDFDIVFNNNPSTFAIKLENGILDVAPFSNNNLTVTF